MICVPLLVKEMPGCQPLPGIPAAGTPQLFQDRSCDWGLSSMWDGYKAQYVLLMTSRAGWQVAGGWQLAGGWWLAE